MWSWYDLTSIFEQWYDLIWDQNKSDRSGLWCFGCVSGRSVIINIIAGKYFIIHIIQKFACYVFRPFWGCWGRAAPRLLIRPNFYKKYGWITELVKAKRVTRTTLQRSGLQKYKKMRVTCYDRFEAVEAARRRACLLGRISTKNMGELRNWLEQSEWRERHCKDPAFKNTKNCVLRVMTVFRLLRPRLFIRLNFHQKLKKRCKNARERNL
jgi:hypothetical protein